MYGESQEVSELWSREGTVYNKPGMKRQEGFGQTDGKKEGISAGRTVGEKAQRL